MNEIHTDRQDLKILQSIRRIIRSVDLDSKRLVTQYNITSPQLVTLYTIQEENNISLAELSKRVYLSPSTLVGIIDRLVQKEWVQREREGKDRRKVLISLTKKGKTFLKKAPSPLQATLQNSLKDLSELEQSAIALSLKRVVDLMEAEQIDAAPILQHGKMNDV